MGCTSSKQGFTKKLGEQKIKKKQRQDFSEFHISLHPCFDYNSTTISLGTNEKNLESFNSFNTILQRKKSYSKKKSFSIQKSVPLEAKRKISLFIQQREGQNQEQICVFA
ncbi:hypothetical protein PPERSA_11290 [Pseudocohnilembus persalinus]|uniref:Uncharacterized protein n=1 Tax=Pseudocohnilembus persalinus TaxID=266149 RepID=A0A0V0QPK6_PSEPJ|nr:hypothetical protein PPERSA_11290 [Pseudocohnilembus persalinus]|eukprot:KRX04166.1 hypothetical protein PPERSA_11290 [Pseudocohnilembus persalinus]